MFICAGVKAIVGLGKRGCMVRTCDKISNGSVTFGLGYLERCLAVLKKGMRAVSTMGARTNVR